MHTPISRCHPAHDINSLFHSGYGADLTEETDVVVCGLVIGEPGVMGILEPIVCRYGWDAEFVSSHFCEEGEYRRRVEKVR